MICIRVIGIAMTIYAAGMLVGCERSMHDMYDQPKYKPSTTSRLFADHSAARTPPIGTMAFSAGEWAQTSSGRLGKTDDHPSSAIAPSAPSSRAPTLATLKHGRQRYDIYCAACHGLTGNGDGMVVQRGFPAPSPFTTPRLVAASDEQLQFVIRNGYGLMYPFADRLNPGDRTAVVAYVRALQLQQHTPASRLNGDDRRALNRVGNAQ